MSTAPAWTSAIAACVGVVVAVTVGVIAFVQLREARRLRREQAQPFVVIWDELSPRSDWVIELVVKNFGRTAARNVKIAIEPELMRAATLNGEISAVPLPPVIPTLAPGQEWRTVWDWTVARFNGDHGLPDRHDVQVTFEDSTGRQLSSDSVLDLGTYRGRRHMGVRTLSDLAKTMSDIEKTMRGFREGIGDGLKVWVRDGAAKDGEERARLQQIDPEHTPPPAEQASPPST